MPGRFDTWDSYFWEPGGTVLRNLYGVRDGAVLARQEYRETYLRQVAIELGRVEIPRTYDAEHVRAIHRELFGNVYEWAGEYRTVGIAKGWSNFAEPTQIEGYLADAARTIRQTSWSSLDRDEFARAAARTYAYVNTAHPFREGNGRSAKVFMGQVAELSVWRIDYDPAASGVTPEKWNQAAMLSSPDRGAHEPVPDSLVPVFRALAQPLTKPGPTAAQDTSGLMERKRAAYPKSATEATKNESGHGARVRRARPYPPGRAPEQGRGE